ncbi:MAG: T9SS C-terminal target domain-containing protein [Sphingobacteriia bacterium]|nr:T9SS C-terminal target domain-containing protein [Sphingobacteriia bacterium]
MNLPKTFHRLLVTALLVFSVSAISSVAMGQVILFVSQPSSIAGSYNYGPGDAAQGWGYSYDTIQVQAPLVRGFSSNAGGDSLACDTTLINASAVAGKICVLYRGSCEFGVKALAAQRAGAVGCIIINHSAGVINMGAGGAGANVRIPVMLVSNSDGALIRARMNGGDSVVVFMGDKTGFFQNDLGIGNGSVLRPTEFSIPSSQALNAGEYIFKLGAAVKNYGQNAQSNVGLNVKIDFTNPAGLTNTVYNQNASIAALPSDSTDTLRTPDFDPSAYGTGKYNIAYTISMPSGTTDQFPADNTVNQGFVINSNIISKVRLDSLRNMVYSGGVRPSAATSGSYDFGIWYYANKGSRLKVDSIRFSFVTNPGSNLFGESIIGKVSEWQDLNSDGLIDAGEIVDLGDGIYTYGDTLGSNSQRSVQITDIINNTPGVVLRDSTVYLFSAYYSGAQTTVFTNVDPNVDYTLTSDIYEQYISPVYSGTWNPNGFGANSVAAVSAVTSSPSSSVRSLEQNTLELRAFPNPVSDRLHVLVRAAYRVGNVRYSIVDLSGRLITQGHEVLDGIAPLQIGVAGLEPGMYHLQVNDGRFSRTLRFIKH